MQGDLDTVTGYDYAGRVLFMVSQRRSLGQEIRLSDHFSEKADRIVTSDGRVLKDRHGARGQQ